MYNQFSWEELEDTKGTQELDEKCKRAVTWQALHSPICYMIALWYVKLSQCSDLPDMLKWLERGKNDGERGEELSDPNNFKYVK